MHMYTRHILFAALALCGLEGAFEMHAQVVNQPQGFETVQPTTVPVPLGPTLDVLPHVSADGYTIQMNLIPTMT